MQISVDVYTESLDAAIDVFKLAVANGAWDARLNAEMNSRDSKERKVKYINLGFYIDHSSPVLMHLDNGKFAHETGRLASLR